MNLPSLPAVWSRLGTLRSALGVALLVGCNGALHLDGPENDDAALDGQLDAPAIARCESDGECPTGLHCDLASGSCVPCTTDTHCPKALPRCDASLHRCVACGVDGDCRPEELCELPTRRCVRRCTTAGVCPAAEMICDTARGFCIGCTTDAECAPKKHCELASGMCVECVHDDQCSKEHPRCEPVTATCVACLSASDCPLGRPVCDATANCIPR
jgi:hypothetical protein